MLDLHLAFAHHVLAFGILGVLAAEIALLRAPVSAGAVKATARIDALYGLMALLLLAAGFARAVYAAKGWVYYSENVFFWAKIGTFAVIGLISVRPTLRFIGWRRRCRTDPSALPPPEEVAGVRRLIWIEVALFGLLPLFAAAMARGYGSH